MRRFVAPAVLRPVAELLLVAGLVVVLVVCSILRSAAALAHLAQATY